MVASHVSAVYHRWQVSGPHGEPVFQVIIRITICVQVAVLTNDERLAAVLHKVGVSNAVDTI